MANPLMNRCQYVDGPMSRTSNRILFLKYLIPFCGSSERLTV